jgi:hypothetical protein
MADGCARGPLRAKLLGELQRFPQRILREHCMASVGARVRIRPVLEPEDDDHGSLAGKQ